MTSVAGKQAIVTGAARGLGLAATRQLQERGARVLMLDRDAEALAAAAADTGADWAVLDLCDAEAIAAFAGQWTAPVDILLNNAGLLPPRQWTAGPDGVELGFAVSVLGHYRLTGQLLPALLRSAAPRVVTVSSIAHSGGRVNPDVTDSGAYDASQAYADAKLAALMFALELQRRADRAGVSLLSVAAHPGISHTGIGRDWLAEPARRWRDRLATFLMDFAMRRLGQSPEQGARPLVAAATVPDAEPASYYGPSGFMHWRGLPAPQGCHRKAHDPQAAGILWERLEALSGWRYAWSSR